MVKEKEKDQDFYHKKLNAFWWPLKEWEKQFEGAENQESRFGSVKTGAQGGETNMDATSI